MKANRTHKSSWMIAAALAGLAGLWLGRRRRSGKYLQPAASASRPRALVTGASSGIGEAFAWRLAASGYDLVLVARREALLQKLAAELAAQYGAQVEIIPADMANPAGLDRVIQAAQAGPQVDILVNNAGFGAPGAFAQSEIECHLDMIRLHDIAAAALMRAVLPGMIARRQGGIINVASVAAFYPLAGNASYSASKAFLTTFSESLQLETARAGVSIQALCPGFTYSQFHDSIEGFQRSRLPAFLWMQAEEVARQSLQALGNGEVIFIPGWINRVIAFFGRVEPLRAIAARAALVVLRGRF